MGRPDAMVRIDLLDATERVLARDGYAAISSRNVAEEAGVTQKLVFYYFQNMEELVVATFRRRSETFLATMEEALASATPLRSLWAISSDRSARLMIQFMAIATRSSSLHDEVARYTESANALQAAVFAKLLAGGKAAPDIPTPAFLSFLVAALARNFALDSHLGLLPDADGMAREIERFLARIES